MSAGKQVNSFIVLKLIGYCLLLLAVSCTVPKKYQPYKPFIFNSSVSIDQKGMRSDEEKELKSRLENQLDDSLKVRTIISVRWVPPFFYNRLAKPPVFDTINVSRSKIFMNALLASQGYFNPTIKDTFRIDTVRDQYRVNVSFNVIPGKQLKIDSVGFFLDNAELQQMVDQHRNQTLLKKGKPYSIPLVSSELDRLINIFRDNGYYKISKEQDIYAEVDTVVAGLINPLLDPFEQARLLEELRAKQENPTINVVIKQRTARDSTRLKKYYIGNVTVYPDLNVLDETDSTKFTKKLGPYTFKYNSNTFKLPFITDRIALRPGELYRQRNYFKTSNNFTQLGAWQNVGVELVERYDSVPILDADIKLYPAKKLSMSLDLESSRNIQDYLATGQLFGIGVNLRLLNRNAYREAVQTSTNARFGIEFGEDFIQTIQANFTHSIAIPRLIAPRWFLKNRDSLVNPRSILSLSAAFTDQRDFAKVQSVNVSWGYEWSRRFTTHQIIIPNFEFTETDKGLRLIELEKDIPSLAFAFNNGLIISGIYSITNVRTRGNKFTYLRGKIEESGGITGMIKSLEEGQLRRFVKVEGEWKHFINYPRSSFAFRSYGGYGYVYGKTGNIPEYNLPFFKAFFGGGPYTMRAWRVRRLGPGTAIIYDTLKQGATDRFGNIQLEGNVEFRFNLFTIAGIKIKSALWADFGNIWSKEFDSNGNSIPEAEFRFDKLYKDIAVGAGTSLRFDFDFFLIRLDWGYKLKDPLYSKINDGWFQNIQLWDGQFQLGVGYPF